MRRLLLLIIALLVVPLAASAHSGGAVFEEKIGDRLLRIGYSTDEIEPLVPVRLTFSLYDGPTAASPGAKFARVWVKIEEGSALRFVGWLGTPSLGPAGMSYAFPAAGTYLVTARFEDEKGESVAEASFSLEAKAPAAGMPPAFWMGLALGAAAGAPLGAMALRRWGRKDLK
jgi:hypothetical protein